MRDARFGTASTDGMDDVAGLIWRVWMINVIRIRSTSTLSVLCKQACLLACLLQVYLHTLEAHVCI